VSVLEARELYRFFYTCDDEVVALRDVSLRVGAGEFVAVMGPSGAGKSTLLRCLAGLETPDGGMVYVAGLPISRRSESERSRCRAVQIGVLFQTGNLFPHLTVIENVRIARRIAPRRVSEASDSLLARLGIAHRANARPGTLSGGEAARAALAVACANQPDVVVADEPTGELDSTSTLHVIRLLQREADRGAAIAVATHSHEVARAADRVVQLDDGRVVA